MLRRFTLTLLCLLLGSAILQPLAAAAVVPCTTLRCTALSIPIETPAACPCCCPAPAPRPASTCVQPATTPDYFLQLSRVQLSSTSILPAPPSPPLLPSPQHPHPLAETLIQLPAQFLLSSGLTARAPPVPPRA